MVWLRVATSSMSTRPLGSPLNGAPEEYAHVTPGAVIRWESLSHAEGCPSMPDVVAMEHMSHADSASHHRTERSQPSCQESPPSPASQMCPPNITMSSMVYCRCSGRYADRSACCSIAPSSPSAC